jgi:hypothetical protein
MMTDQQVEINLEQQEFDEYTSISWQVAIYVLIGTLVALLFDELGLFGYFPEGIVRAIAGTADTLGLALSAIFTWSVFQLRGRFSWAESRLSDRGKPKAVTWITGGLIGLLFAFLVQALVYEFAGDPHGPVGVIYAFAYSNLDNTVAGLTVLAATLVNHGVTDGWKRYWRHPYFAGNAFMLVLIPTIALLVRVLTHFRPELNLSAGIESGLMDVDSVGAAIIFLVATRVFKVPVPYVNEDLGNVYQKVRQRIAGLRSRSLD